MIDYPSLMQSCSRQEFDEAVLILLENPEEINKALKFFESGSTKERNRIAWLLHHLSDLDASVLVPHHQFFIAHAQHSTNDAEKRFISRLFANHGLPNGEVLQGQLLDLVFKWVNDFSESIAVKVNALSVIHRFCKIHPELENELRTIIADQLPNSGPAFQSRSKRILKALNPLRP